MCAKKRECTGVNIDVQSHKLSVAKWHKNFQKVKLHNHLDYIEKFWSRNIFSSSCHLLLNRSHVLLCKMGITPSRYYFLQVRIQYIEGLFYSGIVLQSLFHPSCFIFCICLLLCPPVVRSCDMGTYYESMHFLCYLKSWDAHGGDGGKYPSLPTQINEDVCGILDGYKCGNVLLTLLSVYAVTERMILLCRVDKYYSVLLDRSICGWVHACVLSWN